MPIRVDATIQARTGSSRLPGKVLLPVAGQPLLAWQIRRIQASRLIDRVIVATTGNPQDDPIEELARSLGALCFRGSEEDVLGRVVSALRRFDVDIHVEFCGDNAMSDPLLIDSVVGLFLKIRDTCDYLTTARKTTFPPGSNVTVYPASTLLEAEALWDGVRLREHVGTHIYQRPDRFRIVNLEAPPSLRHPEMYFEVDTWEDYEVICRVYDHFVPHDPLFSLSQAVEYAKESGICEANRNVPRRWRKYRED
jgi:spore coat polysaccharide biosynthesis protein SpsF